MTKKVLMEFQVSVTGGHALLLPAPLSREVSAGQFPTEDARGVLVVPTQLLCPVIVYYHTSPNSECHLNELVQMQLNCSLIPYFGNELWATNYTDYSFILLRVEC